MTGGEADVQRGREAERQRGREANSISGFRRAPPLATRVEPPRRPAGRADPASRDRVLRTPLCALELTPLCASAHSKTSQSFSESLRDFPLR